MTARTDLIAWLQSISGSHILTGQTAHSDGREIDANTAALGFPLAVEFYDPWLDTSTFDDTFFDRSIAHFDANGMVGISLMMPNPLGGRVSDPTGIYADAMLTWGHPQNLALQKQLYRVGQLLWRYKNATPKPVFLRPFFEMNGWWSWWGTSVFNPQQFIALWRFAWWYWNVACQLDNLIITWGPNSAPASYRERYPGDDVVDMVGMSAYTNNLDADCWQVYNNLRAIAPSKLIALTERGSGNPNGQDHSFDARRLFADILQWMPRIVYVNWWPGWGPSGEQHAVEALTAPYVLNRP